MLLKFIYKFTFQQEFEQKLRLLEHLKDHLNQIIEADKKDRELVLQEKTFTLLPIIKVNCSAIIARYETKDVTFY